MVFTQTAKISKKSFWGWGLEYIQIPGETSLLGRPDFFFLSWTADSSLLFFKKNIQAIIYTPGHLAPFAGHTFDFIHAKKVCHKLQN